GGGPFHTGGLHFIIVSKTPDHIKQMLWLEHTDSNRILEAVEEIGIEEDLKAAGKRWFALSPRFFKDEAGNEIIKFWLNPMEQHLNDSGWFTEEELRQWIKDEGPIPMKAKKGLNSV